MLLQVLLAITLVLELFVVHRYVSAADSSCSYWIEVEFSFDSFFDVKYRFKKTFVPNRQFGYLLLFTHFDRISMSWRDCKLKNLPGSLETPIQLLCRKSRTSGNHDEEVGMLKVTWCDGGTCHVVRVR